MRIFGIVFSARISKAARAAAADEAGEARERLVKASDDLRRVIAAVLDNNETLRGDHRVQGTRK
jgi:hypothetical protein